MMYVSNVKNRFLLLVALWLGSYVQVLAQWETLEVVGENQFVELDFPEDQYGYGIVAETAGYYKLYKSTDAGESWKRVEVEFIENTQTVLQAIAFPSKDVGYVVLRANTFGLQTYVFKTTDGGDNWEDVSPEGIPVGYGNADAHFLSETTGYIATANALYGTTDGGKSWTRKAVTSFHGINQIDFYNDDLGMMGTWDGTFLYTGAIYTTKDGGDTWDSLDLKEYQTAIRKVEYAGAKTLYALSSERRSLYRSMDGGSKWDTIKPKVLSDSVDIPFDIEFVDAETGYMSTGKGYVYKTEDSGDSWILDHDKTYNLNQLFFTGTMLWASGAQGVLLRKDLGLHIERPTSQNVQLYPNPCSAQGVLNVSGLTPGKYQMVNILGKAVAEVSLYEQNTIELSKLGLQPGQYVLKSLETTGASRPFILK